MIPAIRTRLRRSRPLINFSQKTLMFTTFIPQYLNKLVEGKVRDFTSPQPFHTVKVKRLNDDRIKLLAKFRRQLPMKVFALVGNLPIESGNLSNTTPPTIRTFLFTTQCLVEMPKLLQGVFQRLWVLFLFTRAQGQVCVFHTEVCPNAFTCCRQRVSINTVRCYTEPIVTAGITLYRYTSNRTLPLTVLEKGKWNFIKLPFTCVRMPFTKGYRDTISLLFSNPAGPG